MTAHLAAPTAAPTGGPDPETAGPGGQRRLSVEERTALANRLFTQYPDAAIGAVAVTGRFVPMPATVPLTGQTVIAGCDTALELIRPEDTIPVIEGWKLTTEYGTAVVEAHAVDDPDRDLTLYFVDTRDQYGVLLAFVIRSDGSAPGVSLARADTLRARLTVVRKTRLAEFLAVDDAFERILGYAPGEIIGRRNLDLVHPDDHARAIANWIDMLGQPNSTRRARLRHRHADGHWVWFEVTNHNRLADPGEDCVVAEMIDISDEMQAQEELRASQQLLARLTDALPVGVVQVDVEGALVYANRRADQILGSGGADSMSGLFARVVEEDQQPLSAAVRSVLEQRRDVDVELAAEHRDGRLVRCRASLRALDNDGAVTGAIICIDDITERARLREQLEHRATYDPLTGCLNRASLLAELDRALDEARSERTGVAVVFVDLDGFKSVNDSRGHTAGDAVLKQIGQYLLAAARRGDIVGRVGGDEFLVVGRDVPSAELAVALAQRMADGLAANVAAQPGHRAVASLGVAWTAGGAPVSADALVGRADDAMYVSKRDGYGRPVLG